MIFRITQIESYSQEYELIIKDCHEKGAHIEGEHTLALICHKMWIPSYQGLSRNVLFDCFYHKHEFIEQQNTLMIELPKGRLSTCEKPFYNTDIYFFGPILVKLSKKTHANHQNRKRYGVIFTCKTTRAIHSEIAGYLSTYSFILALQKSRLKVKM